MAHCPVLSLSSFTASPEYIFDQFRKRTSAKYFKRASCMHTYVRAITVSSHCVKEEASSHDGEG